MKRRPPAQAHVEIDAVIVNFGDAPFSSKQFIDAFQAIYPAKWDEIVKQYKAGGKGSGIRFSAAGFIGRQLDFRCDKKKLVKLPRQKAPLGWGNPWISVWQSFSGFNKPSIYPDEVEIHNDLWEGAKKKTFVNKYERDKTARIKCIEHYGCACCACGLDFSERYGEHGTDFIHVHHLTPLHTIGRKYKVDPIADLRPVCPNCHAMIHYRGGLLSIEDVQEMLALA